MNEKRANRVRMILLFFLIVGISYCAQYHAQSTVDTDTSSSVNIRGAVILLIIFLQSILVWGSVLVLAECLHKKTFRSIRLTGRYLLVCCGCKAVLLIILFSTQAFFSALPSLYWMLEVFIEIIELCVIFLGMFIAKGNPIYSIFAINSNFEYRILLNTCFRKHIFRNVLKSKYYVNSFFLLYFVYLLVMFLYNYILLRNIYWQTYVKVVGLTTMSMTPVLLINLYFIYLDNRKMSDAFSYIGLIITFLGIIYAMFLAGAYFFNFL